MPTWGIKYGCTFDPIGEVSATPVYSLGIFEKDYTGDPTVVIASGIPVLHQWQTDDPKAPIKGSSLSISLINQNGSLPLSSFFSTDDDQFKVQFYWGLQLLFEGFLVQDDCSEIMVDYTHEINLSATDNLGLLKDVALDKAKIIYDIIASATDTWSLTAPHTLTLPAAIAATVHAGDIIHIDNIIFTIEYHVTETTGGVDMTVSETVTTGAPGGSDDIEVRHPRDFDDKVTLAFIIENCLWATGLELNTYVWGRITEQSQNETTSFIDQTLIDPGTFLKDETQYDNCYSVLEKLFAAFKMTCFQAKGVWNIMRWDELRYYSNAMLAYVYDPDFAMIDEVSMDAEFEAGIGELTVAETAPLQKILRPFSFTKETFNYKQPVNLLRNWDLQTTGNLLNEYTSGAGVDLLTIKEYEAPWWFDSDLDAAVATWFIRVTTDIFENEVERVMVIDVDNIKSFQIEAAAGDSFVFTFTFKTEDAQADQTNDEFIIELNDGITQNFFHNPAFTPNTPGNMWRTDLGWTYIVDSNDNTDEWQTITIDSTYWPIPYDGLLYVYLCAFDSGGDKITYYKDIRFEYVPRINQSVKIIGQTHRTEQPGNIKQNEDEEIFVDDSPRNSIAGTLFLDSLVGVLQERTVLWGHPYLTQAIRLGELITFEQQFWRRVSRTILEGTFYGLIHSANHVSMLSVFRYTFFPTLTFVPGTMEIDYRNNKFSGTLWEIWEDSEVDGDLIATYIFKYLYSTK